MKFRKVIFFGLFFFNLLGCSLVAPQRTFVGEMENSDDELIVPGKDFRVVQGDNGKQYRSREEIFMRTPANKDEKKYLRDPKALYEELKRLEDELSSDEYYDYMKVKDKFQTTSEKIQYLSQRNQTNQFRKSTFGDLHEQGTKNKLKVSSHEQLAIHQREIILGMSKEAVSKSWGSPVKVEVAGNPNLENERWAFYDKGKYKYVYFESGRVSGWILE